MRQFRQFEISPVCSRDATIVRDLRGFKKFADAIASAFDLSCSLKPEAALLLELFEAEKTSKRLTVSMLGLLDGIAPTTALRYLELLENCGALKRSSHENDKRMSYVELTPDARWALEEAIASVSSIS